MAWSAGSARPLSPQDFDDLLTLSQEYVGAVGEYEGKAVEAPWAPELTDEETAELHRAIERQWDIAMGVAG